jgi:hypothetical protein
VAGRRHPVVEALDYQRRHVNSGQHGPDVDLADHRDDPQKRARAHRHALETGKQSPGLGRAGPAGEEPVDGRALTPAVRGDLREGIEHLG